ncbi:replication restart helicase PriA [Pelotomaculum propionicicum]|uniref:replication restart helicase PriA n=1 Tax=Pelotomaculum propionicicum TaxID=258475 RepID=UPI003B7B4B73
MSDTGQFAEIIVDISARGVDRVFHYAVPAELKDKVKPGSRVLVPFGGRRLAGYVVGFGYPERDVKVREIAGILDEEPVLTEDLLEIARWMADSYLCSTAEAFSRIIAPRLGVKAIREVKLLRPAFPADKTDEVLSGLKHAPKQASVLREALLNPRLTRKELAAAAQTSPATVDTLVKAGLLEAEKVASSYYKDEITAGFTGDCLTRLNPDQEKAVEEISKALTGGKFGAFLLYGVTGSGKTEVYLGAIASALAAGRQAVTMVPEISLTPQMIGLFRERFGSLVAVLHSGLAGRERYDEWRRVKEGKAPVVLGTRSAVFAPLPRPGLFILDEEHEPSYKQDDHLRYHAREIAIKRAQLSGAAVVLGSATPSLESWYRSGRGGPYRLIKLPHRIDKKPLPHVTVVDLRQEIKDGNRGIFSRPLVAAVFDRLRKGEQTILFLNRRGYATFVVCRECGHVLKCGRCDISLTYHLDGVLRCHYCNYNTGLPAVCPGCGSGYIRHFGAGTQKVEDEAAKIFTGARILRMDSDSTAQRGSHEKILGAFRQGQADILIGTQMIAKGLDLPKVTLVGVVNADTTLFMPDFRAAERTFQLLTQVAGRSGRGKLPGEVLVQTYCPDHYSIAAAARHDVEGFYRDELPLRKSLGYPPFSYLARILFTHGDEGEISKGALLVKEILDKKLSGHDNFIEVLGPAPAPLSRIKGRFRWQLVIKGPRRAELKDIIRECLDDLENLRPSFKPAINIDINPQGMQ